MLFQYQNEYKNDRIMLFLFQAKGVKVIANDGTNFEVTNAKPIKNGKFGVLFSATYNMTDGECPSLGGSCTDIEETG